MTKPDYIPFSQEIFDELQESRRRYNEDPGYIKTKEFAELAHRLLSEAISNEYKRFLKEEKTK